MLRRRPLAQSLVLTFSLAACSTGQVEEDLPDDAVIVESDTAPLSHRTTTWSSPDNIASHFGQAGDIPAPGDYDGKDSVAVYRHSESKSYIDWDASMSCTAGDRIIQFGGPSVQPVAVRRR